VNKINGEFVKLFSDASFIDYLNHQAVVSAPTTPAGFAAFLKEDRKAAESLIKIANSKREEYKPQ
jgi:tripartite-type tricarboxylate transporter receptor subunit TctC